MGIFSNLAIISQMMKNDQQRGKVLSKSMRKRGCCLLNGADAPACSVMMSHCEELQASAMH
jgi:hypothetical protein